MARFSEIARGQIAGDHSGMLKLLFHRETRKLLGVHVIGESATEIVHIGQAVMALGGTIDYFRDTVFNYPTMAECYKVAALDGLNKLSLWEEAESTCDAMMPAIEIATEAIQAAVLVASATPVASTGGSFVYHNVAKTPETAAHSRRLFVR